MRRQVYRAPASTVATSPPDGVWHAIPCPGAPQWSLVVVAHFSSDEAEDAWEALPSVTEYYPENLGQLCPAAMVAAFAPWGVTATDTIREALRKIRQHWPACR